MPFHYKAMIAVMVFTTIVFLLAKPVFTQFMLAEDFARRRNTWLILTLAMFLIPNFWLYILVAVPVIWYAAKKDTNPIALYFFLLLAVPPLRQDIPAFGIVKNIFPLDHLRVLALFVLLPLATRVLGRANEPSGDAGPPVKLLADKLIWAYVALQFILLLPYESVTASMRRGFLLGIDILLPYFIISRAIRSREMIVEVMAAFALGAVTLVLPALYEVYISSSLYGGIETRWDSPLMFVYLARGDYFRAQATAGHSITLCFLLAMAFGFWLYLHSRFERRFMSYLGLVGLCVGMLATFARGPWLGALLLFVAFLALGPKAGPRLFKAALAGAVVAGVLLATPYAHKVLDYVPFVGSGGADSLDYRAQLAEASWHLVQAHPIFGNPFYMLQMEELRQGQGIIDMVNTYASIALAFGLVGLAVFGAFFVTITWNAIRVARHHAQIDPDYSLIGVSLAACLVSTLAVIATTSFGLGLAAMSWGLAALTVGYVRVAGHQAMPQWTAEPNPAR